MSVVIVGTGAYLPGPAVRNREVAALARYPEEVKKRTLDEWALAHHGGRSRHHCAPSQTTVDLATAACEEALARSGTPAADLHALVLASFTGEDRLPGPGPEVQRRLGSGAKVFHLHAACTGFVDALELASSWLDDRPEASALVVATDRLTSVLEPDDWLAWSVFGDGASAAVLRTEDSRPDAVGFLAFASGTDGDLAEMVRAGPAGSVDRFMRVDFSGVSTWAVDRMAHASELVLERAGLGFADIDVVVPHQASAAIIDRFADRMNIPGDRVLCCFGRLGNTGGSSIGIGLNEVCESGRLSSGSVVLLPAVGAGMAWSAAVYRCP